MEKLVYFTISTLEVPPVIFLKITNNCDTMKKDFLIGLGIIAVSFFILLSIFDISTTQPEIILEVGEQVIKEVEKPKSISEISSNVVEINLPAVDNQGNGVIAKLKVQAITGEGRVLTNINQLLFWVDTQFSIRVAKMVAENITGKDLSNVDLIYTIETDASLIEGQSAGAALTIATIAVIENKTLPEDVMITGTINPDGVIGSVGAIFAKAKASKDVGAKLFLVPDGQGTQTNYRPERTCEQIGPITFCTTEYKAERIDISKDAGIEVKEVSTINDALKYFIG